MSMERQYIKIKELEVNNNRIIYRFSYTKDIRKYFLSNTLYAKYDRKIDNIDRSILHIPALSNIIMLAWTVGADVYVEEIDETYLKALYKIRSVMKKWYPKLSFNIEINVKNVVSNNFFNKGYGLLFTGGIDSTASYIRHRDKKPNLILIRGLQIPLSLENAWGKYKERMIEFSKYENVEINFIETNMREFLNEGLINAKYKKKYNRFMVGFPSWCRYIRYVCTSNESKKYQNTFNCFYTHAGI